MRPAEILSDPERKKSMTIIGKGDYCYTENQIQNRPSREVDSLLVAAFPWNDEETGNSRIFSDRCLVEKEARGNQNTGAVIKRNKPILKVWCDGNAPARNTDEWAYIRITILLALLTADNKIKRPWCRWRKWQTERPICYITFVRWQSNFKGLEMTCLQKPPWIYIPRLLGGRSNHLKRQKVKVKLRFIEEL